MEYIIYFKNDNSNKWLLSPSIQEVKRYIHKCYPKLIIKKIELRKIAKGIK